ncbi:MAG: DUF4347 domain-containing protein [Leptolyngbyaceae cyanobacterium CSU_1_4]|nr:DUF4347 domain-containing protein [Leptolyngbyaceae cyanobacterium CSU_1_4]
MSAIAPITSLVFIDVAVADYQSLIDGLAPGSEAIVLDPAQDGVEQITAALAGRSDIQSVHLVSHGSSGRLQLGAATLNGESIDRYQAQLQEWRSALTEDADILIYGCDVAGDDAGQAFVRSLSQITGADVAASNDLTGSSQLGGDWDLEIQTGDIESAAAFRLDAMQSYQAVLPAFLDQNFDAVTAGTLPTGWTVTATGAVANWTSVNTSSSTVNHSAFTVNAASNSTNYIISPALTLASAAQLSFQHRYGTDDNFDGGVLEISINGGAFTDILTAGGSFVQGGYSGALNGSENSPFGTRQAWFGNLPDFSPVLVNLPAAAVGQSIRLRWGFGAGDTVGGTGWFIDNVEINTTTLPIIRLSTPDAAAAETGSNLGVYRINRTNTSAALAVKLDINGSSTASPSDYTFSVSAGSVSVVGSTVTVNLPVGVGTVNLTLTPVSDALTEPDETLRLDLASDAAYTINTVNNTGTVTIAANIGNTAPTLIDTTVTLAVVNEDAGTPVGAVGTLVSAIVTIGGNVTDTDAGAVTGIAITAADTSNGTCTTASTTAPPGHLWGQSAPPVLASWRQTPTLGCTFNPTPTTTAPFPPP